MRSEDVNDRHAQTLCASPLIQKTLNLPRSDGICRTNGISRQNERSSNANKYENFSGLEGITPHGDSYVTPCLTRDHFSIYWKMYFYRQNNYVGIALSSFFFNPRRFVWSVRLPLNILARKSAVKAQNERRSFYPLRREYPSFPVQSSACVHVRAKLAETVERSLKWLLSLS